MDEIIIGLRKELKETQHIFTKVSIRKGGGSIVSRAINLYFETPSWTVPCDLPEELDMGRFSLRISFKMSCKDNSFYMPRFSGKSLDHSTNYRNVHPNICRTKKTYGALCLGNSGQPVANLIKDGDMLSAMYLMWDVLRYCDRGLYGSGYCSIRDTVQYKKKITPPPAETPIS